MQWRCLKMLIIVGREDSVDSIEMDVSVVYLPQIKDKWKDILQFGVQIMNMTEGDTAFYNPFPCSRL
jgi:hypothetical protein